MATRAAFWFLLAVAGWLRLYHLDTPSMWLDEILVPMAARHPIAYIFDLVTTAEVHPPTYYLLVKAWLAAGTSDFTLRLPSAVLGVAAVAALHRLVREHVSAAAAYPAAAFLAVSPLALYVSRVVRMYSLLILLFILSVDFLLRYLRTGEKSGLVKLLLCNAGMVLLHYVTFLIMAVEFFAMAWDARRGRGRRSLAGLGLYLLGSALSLSLVGFFFASRLLRTHRGQFMGFSYLQTLENIVWITGQVLYLFNDWRIQAALAAAVLFGLIRMLRDRNADTGAAFLCLAVLPPLFLAATKYDYYAFNVWHLSFLLVPFAVLLGRAAAVLLPRPFPAAAVSCLGAAAMAGFILGPHYRDFFAWDTAITPYYTLSKPLAKNLPPLIDGEGAIAFCDFSTLNGYYWYSDQFNAMEPVRRQAVEPARETVPVRFVSGSGSFGAYARSEDEFLARYGRPASVAETYQVKVYRFDVKRASPHVIAALPYVASFNADLTAFYRDADRAERVMLDSNWNGAACPADSDQEAVVEYAFENTAATPQLIVSHQEFTNTGRGNRYAVSYRFDEEPWTQAKEAIGPTTETDLGFVIERKAAYRRLTVRIAMRAAPLTADFAGGNQMTVGLRRFDLRAAPLKEAL